MLAKHSVVTPAQAGVQGERRNAGVLDSRFRGNDADYDAEIK